MTKANLPNSKWFCICGTGKSNCQVFTQSHILLDFNTILNFFYHSQIKFSLYCRMERGHQLILKQRLVEIYFDESRRHFWKWWVQDTSRWVARISDVCRHRTGGHHNQNHMGGMNVGYSSTYTITNVVLVLFLTVHFFVVWFPAPIKLTVLVT
jgi:hypothetical protein